MCGCARIASRSSRHWRWARDGRLTARSRGHFALTCGCERPRQTRRPAIGERYQTIRVAAAHGQVSCPPTKEEADLMGSRSVTPYLIAAVVGGGLWLATGYLAGRREAWDAAEYWMMAYPAGLVVSAAVGYFAPARSPWGIGLALMAAQAVVLAVQSRSFALLPLGMSVFAVLALPAVATA